MRYYCVIHNTAEDRPTGDCVELPGGVIVRYDYSHVVIGPYADSHLATAQGPKDMLALLPPTQKGQQT